MAELNPKITVLKSTGDYQEAPEKIYKRVARLIENHHDFLASAKIRVVFKRGSWNKNGKTVFGSTQKISDKINLISGADFLITLNKEKWHMLGYKGQQAVLDHELSHCDTNDQGKWCTVEHDFTGFNAVLRRHGLWSQDLQSMDQALKQMNIFSFSDAQQSAAGDTN